MHNSAVAVEDAPPRVKVPLATDRSAPTAKALVDVPPNVRLVVDADPNVILVAFALNIVAVN